MPDQPNQPNPMNLDMADIKDQMGDMAVDQMMLKKQMRAMQDEIKRLQAALEDKAQ